MGLGLDLRVTTQFLWIHLRVAFIWCALGSYPKLFTGWLIETSVSIKMLLFYLIIWVLGLFLFNLVFLTWDRWSQIKHSAKLTVIPPQKNAGKGRRSFSLPFPSLTVAWWIPWMKHDMYDKTMWNRMWEVVHSIGGYMILRWTQDMCIYRV